MLVQWANVALALFVTRPEKYPPHPRPLHSTLERHDGEPVSQELPHGRQEGPSVTCTERVWRSRKRSEGRKRNVKGRGNLVLDCWRSISETLRATIITLPLGRWPPLTTPNASVVALNGRLSRRCRWWRYVPMFLPPSSSSSSSSVRERRWDGVGEESGRDGGLIVPSRFLLTCQRVDAAAGLCVRWHEYRSTCGAFCNGDLPGVCFTVIVCAQSRWWETAVGYTWKKSWHYRGQIGARDNTGDRDVASGADVDTTKRRRSSEPVRMRGHSITG